MKKEKVRLFERIRVDDPEWARKTYDRENARFKIKMICTAVSLLTPIGWWVYSWGLEVGAVLDFVFSLLMMLGWGATIVAAPGQVFKTILALAKIGWYIVPFVFFDLIGFVAGMSLGLVAFLYVPTVFCAMGIYQSHLNRKAAEEYLALSNIAKNQ